MGCFDKVYFFSSVFFSLFLVLVFFELRERGGGGRSGVNGI